MLVKFLRRMRRRAELALLGWQSPPVVILMRYSVLHSPENGGAAWRLGRGTDLDGIRAKLFDANRLNQRLLALQRVVLPSLKGQTVALNPRRHRLAVITSQSLPTDHMQALRDALAPYPWARVETVAVDAPTDYQAVVSSFLKETGAGNGVVVTARLDDDDALGKRYLERLIVHATPANDGNAVTFPLGYIGVYDAEKGAFSRFSETRLPFTAQGLAHIETYDGNQFCGRTVFGLGNHMKVGSRWPYVTDDSFRAYIRSVYREQDTRGGDMKAVKESPGVPAREVRRHVRMPITRFDWRKSW